MALDGDFCNRAYSFLKDFGNVKVIENLYKPDSKNFIFVGARDYFDAHFFKDIHLGKKFVLVTLSSTIGNKYYDKLKEMDDQSNSPYSKK